MYSPMFMANPAVLLKPDKHHIRVFYQKSWQVFQEMTLQEAAAARLITIENGGDYSRITFNSNRIEIEIKS